VVLVLAGAVAGVLVGPRIGDGRQAVEAATTAKWVSCPGVAFAAADSGQAFGLSDLRRTGLGVFDCPLGLPNGATITAVRFHLFDADAVANIGCRIHRVRLADGLHQFVTESRGTNGTPGSVTLGAASITHALVDDRQFGYFAGCSLGADSTELGIGGVSIRYVA
jgi:hypothetical protein